MARKMKSEMSHTGHHASLELLCHGSPEATVSINPPRDFLRFDAVSSKAVLSVLDAVPVREAGRQVRILFISRSKRERAFAGDVSNLGPQKKIYIKKKSYNFI